MSWDGKFKYEPMNKDRVDSIFKKCDTETLDYIKELYELIKYQKDTINSQRIEIIALKHKQGWVRYDKT
jgi:hypothetical protein